MFGNERFGELKDLMDLTGIDAAGDAKRPTRH
jgi:hypothetical protein